MTVEKYITRAEAAALLRVTLRTIARYLAEGRLTRRGPRGRVLIERAQVEALAGAQQPQEEVEP